MSVKNPQIKYAVVGLDDKILCDHFDKYSDIVSHTTDVTYPSLKKKGFEVKSEEA